MVVNGEVHTAELTYAGQEVSITETAASFYNERQKVKVELSKTLETDELFGIGANGEITAVSFGLYACLLYTSNPLPKKPVPQGFPSEKA